MSKQKRKSEHDNDEEVKRLKVENDQLKHEPKQTLLTDHFQKTSKNNDQEDVEMEEQNQQSSKDDKLMSSSSSSSTPKILVAFLMEQVHPDLSLASDAALFINQVATTIVAAVKMSKVEEKIFTLPIVKSCIASCLQGSGELLKHAESEGSKALQSLLPRVDQLKHMEEQQNKELENMEKDFKKALAEEKITQQQFDDRHDENKRKLLEYPVPWSLRSTLYSQINETKLNALIRTLLMKRNKLDAENVINLDFAKYGLTPNDETKQLMSIAEELATRGEELVTRVTAVTLSIQSVVSFFFQATGHTINEEALVYLAAVVEYLMAEIFELSGNDVREYQSELNYDNAASGCKSDGDVDPPPITVVEERKTKILACDIQEAMRNDEQLAVMCTNLNISTTDYEPLFQLISGVDGQTTQLLLSNLLRYWKCEDSEDSSTTSSAFTLLAQMDCSSELNVIIPNVTTTGIQMVVDWHFNTDRGTIKSTDKDGKVITDPKKLEQLEKWKQRNAADPTLYANAIMACNFLGCDQLANELLESFEDSGNHPINTIRSCFQSIPNFVRILLYRGLPAANEAAAEDFLTNLTTKNVQELSYVELQLCDGLYLCEGALSNTSKPQQIEPLVGLSPVIHYKLYEMNKDGFFKNKDSSQNSSNENENWKSTTHLNLKKWTQIERQRRKDMIGAEKTASAVKVAAVKEQMASAIDSSSDEEDEEDTVLSAEALSAKYQAKFLIACAASVNTLDQALWSAVANDDLVAAKTAYAKGASPNLWFAGGVAIPYSEYTSHMQGWGQNGSGICWSAAYRNAVCKDTSTFFDNATEPHLMTHGLTTLMKASQNNSLEMMNWLIDVGVRFFSFLSII